ncbi:SDR family NAD(P)-dependent oxidoreductase, partial [Streptomyces sp. SID5926]|nr:SDR family NAD(P)-dependent oxidoreductase [Streptomyces sp. SID5926]
MDSRKIALVTGANRGLGRSTAVALAQRGARVVVTHRGDEAGARETVEAVRAAGSAALALRLDISDVASFPAFAVQLGEHLRLWDAEWLDILVNNAGVGIFGPLEQVSVSDFDAMMETNVRGTFFLIQALLPLLADPAGVINVSSSLTRHSSPATAVYSASKAAIEALS